MNKIDTLLDKINKNLENDINANGINIDKIEYTDIIDLLYDKQEKDGELL